MAELGDLISGENGIDGGVREVVEIVTETE